MIGYITMGTNDMEKAAAFYDELLAVIGAGRFMEMETFIAWATDPGSPGLSITKPFDGNPATVGNGNMTAITVKSKEQVAEVHAKALELGAQDEGAVGARSDNFYAGYFRDLDGNKLAVFCMT